MDQPNKVERLTREERIRRRLEFLRVQKHGVRARGRYMTLIGLPTTGALSRLGVISPRRLGKAVWRNHSKRLARNLFRISKPQAALDLVVLPRREFLDVRFAVLLDDYRQTLRRLVQD